MVSARSAAGVATIAILPVELCMRVLLVEDHHSGPGSVVDPLQESGVGADGVSQARGAPIAGATVRLDAVILDLGLSDSDGKELRC